MKKQKWKYRDTFKISENNELETGIIPMPEMHEITSPHVTRIVKPKKRIIDEDNSLLIHEGSRERFAKESELDWDRVDAKNTYVHRFQKWEGCVVEVLEDTFVARLTDGSGKRLPRLAEIKKTLVNRGDWDTFFHEGFEFEWLFKEVITNGTFSRKNEIRFTPVTHYLPEEIEDFVRKSMNDFSYMLKNDD
jgi:hypothetical protein